MYVLHTRLSHSYIHLCSFTFSSFSFPQYFIHGFTLNIFISFFCSSVSVCILKTICTSTNIKWKISRSFCRWFFLSSIFGGLWNLLSFCSSWSIWMYDILWLEYLISLCLWKLFFRTVDEFISILIYIETLSYTNENQNCEEEKKKLKPKKKAKKKDFCHETSIMWTV